jgi:hypothetical protein
MDVVKEGGKECKTIRQEVENMRTARFMKLLMVKVHNHEI